VCFHRKTFESRVERCIATGVGEKGPGRGGKTRQGYINDRKDLLSRPHQSTEEDKKKNNGYPEFQPHEKRERRGKKGLLESKMRMAA